MTQKNADSSCLAASSLADGSEIIPSALNKTHLHHLTQENTMTHISPISSFSPILALVSSVAVMCVMVGCNNRDSDGTDVNGVSWGTTKQGQVVRLFTLRNANGMEAKIMDYGATVVSLTTPDRRGVMADVVLGFDTLSDYLTPGKSPYFGCIAGRYANRIADGKFSLDGQSYSLAKNNTNAGKACTLHGGLMGFDKVVWTATALPASPIGQGLRLTYISKDGEEGYPGTLTLSVTYLLGPDNSLNIAYEATTDKATVVNPTNHSYFNLNGAGNGNILSHVLTIHASRMTPVTNALIPTGALAPVDNTPFDFTKPHTIGERVNAKHEQLDFGGGYDHNFVIDRQANNELLLAATVEEPLSGRVMEVLTTEPGIQLYIGNFLPAVDVPADKRLIGKQGKVYSYRSAFCLETQHYPDSPNQASFPTTILRPGEIFTSQTAYRFSTK